MRIILSLVLLWPLAALGDPIRIVTDILPVHSLVVQVTEGVTTPSLLLSGNNSPHDHRFRPSEAQALQDADVVIWAGHSLTPWLEAPLETLASDATHLSLLETDGWEALEPRHDPAFTAHDDHDDNGGDHEGHDHEDHDIDPHAWLSPDVAAAWVHQIANTLSEVDPENAARYRENAAGAVANLTSLKVEITETLAPVRGRAYVVPHDALQYFEVAFDLPAAGAIALSDASAPSPARIQTLHAVIAMGDITCVLSDPQVSPAWVALVIEGTQANTAVTDTLGTDIPAGPEQYGNSLRQMATAIAGCLAE